MVSNQVGFTYYPKPNNNCGNESMQSMAQDNMSSAVSSNVVTASMGFDFTQVPSGTPMLVCPTLISDLSVGGNKRRNKQRSAEFKESIKAKGVIQSLSVRPSTTNPNRLELCAGYGRRDTALELGLASVPVIVNSFSDKESLAIMLTENKDRENISIVDEADLAQSYLSLHDGDLNSAALHLGLNLNVFRERLLLKRLSENVLEKLADPSNKFSLGHALILSTFDEKTQEQTLEAILADPQTYTVKELKLRASKRQLNLKTAPFDTADCQKCQYNTGEQFDLLGDNECEAKCSLPSCFNEKAQSWVKTTRSQELEEKYGRVILWEAKPENDRRTVTAESVGDKQFADGCMSCESKCVVVDDRPMRWGNYIVDQCINTDCFTELAAANKQVIEDAKNAQELKQSVDIEANTTEREASSNVDAQQEKVAIKSRQTEASLKRKTSAAALEDYRAQLRHSSANVLLQDKQFRMAMALASLCDISHYKPECLQGEHKTFNQQVMVYMALDSITIQKEMGNAVVHHATAGGRESTCPTDLMIDALASREDGLSIATADWLPTSDRLNMYNIAQIQKMCSDAGFIDSYEQANGEGSISSLFNSRKTEIIKQIMEFEFDWSHYAPTDYQDLLKQ